MKWILLIISLLITSSVFSQEVFKNDDLTISVLEKNVWVIDAPGNVTMYLIEGENKAMLIDTGNTCEDLDKIVRSITQKPLLVVVTHAHPDHVGNLNYFDEIYLHPDETVLLKSYNTNYKGKVNYMSEGDIFDLGGKKIEVRLMPGHTSGSVILLDWATGCCYSGDAFGSGQVVWMQLQHHLPMTTYYESCKKMLELMDKGITKIYGGHFSQSKRNALGKDYVQKMERLALLIIEGKADPKPYKYGDLEAAVIMDGDVGIVYDPINP